MGKFQKRIETLAKLIEKSQSISEEDTIIFPKLRKMVASAKKEFPRPNAWLKNIFTLNADDLTIKQIHDSIVAVAELNCKRLKWFEKWFGES